MNTINQTKQLAESDTPVLFFECTLPSGDVERWSTHGITLGGQNYSARVLRHDVFDLQLSSDDAMDGISQLSLQLANADSELSQLNAVIGFKGSQLTVYFAFVDLSSGEVTTETTVLFRGIAGDPGNSTETVNGGGRDVRPPPREATRARRPRHGVPGRAPRRSHHAERRRRATAGRQGALHATAHG